MTTENSLVRTQELLWNGLPETTKGPRPTLTLDQVVAAGIAIADAEGIEALSMRRLAKELGMGTMSLYRYVPGKPELISLMLDRVLGAPADQFADLGDDWRAVLDRAARDGRRTYLLHRWLLQVNVARSLIGPSSMASIDATLAALRSLPMSDRDKLSVITAIDGFVVGTVRTELLYEKGAEETGVSDEEFWELQIPYFNAAMETGRYPTMMALDEDAFDGPWEETFELGLSAMLDGLELRVARLRS